MINPFPRLLHHYTYNLKLKSKLIISHTIPFLLPIAVLTGFLFLKMYAIITDDAIRSEQALASQTAISIQNIISRVSHSSDTLSSSTVIRGLFNTSRRNAGSYEMTQGQATNLLFLADSLTDSSLITSIRIYYDHQAYEDLTQYNQPDQVLFQPVSSVMSSRWYPLLTSGKKDHILCPGSYLNQKEAEELGELAYITKIPYITEGRDTTADRFSAYIALYFSGDSLDQVLRTNSTYEDDASYLAGSDMLAVSPDEELAMKHFFPTSQLASVIGEPGTISLVSRPEGSVYACYFSIPGTDWYLISVIPELHIQESGQAILYHFAAVYGVFALLALLIAMGLSVSIAHRISRVARQMELVRTGRPQPLVMKDTGKDEIGVLAETYNYMTHEINSLMDSQEKTSRDLARAEFRALQAQINPHFLYNTLDMINWLAQEGQTRKVTQAVQALSRFYKLTLSRGELTHRIKDELAHVSLYMELQNMRYDDCVEFIVDVPSELNQYMIPKLTFQPIVENALLHGIMMKTQKTGSILLTGWRSEDAITFLISDDGMGIPPEKLDTLLKKNPADRQNSADRQDTASRYAPGSRRIGVYNTHLRLKSLYGQAYGLSFESVYGQGTEVTIRIPAVREEV